MPEDEDIKKCMHCGNEFKVIDIPVSMTVKYQGIEMTDYICPFCEKVMNGCTTVTDSR